MRIQQHKAKLAEYKSNPWKYDNKQHLARNADNAERISEIIQNRILKLEKEIEKFEREIQKILEGK